MWQERAVPFRMQQDLVHAGPGTFERDLALERRASPVFAHVSRRQL